MIIVLIFFLGLIFNFHAYADDQRTNIQSVFELNKNIFSSSENIYKALKPYFKIAIKENAPPFFSGLLKGKIDNINKESKKYLSEIIKDRNRHIFPKDVLYIASALGSFGIQMAGFSASGNEIIKSKIYDSPESFQFFLKVFNPFLVETQVNDNKFLDDNALKYITFISELNITLDDVLKKFNEKGYYKVHFSNEKYWNEKKTDIWPIQWLYDSSDYGEFTSRKKEIVKYIVDVTEKFGGDYSFPNTWEDGLIWYKDINNDYEFSLKTIDVLIEKIENQSNDDTEIINFLIEYKKLLIKWHNDLDKSCRLFLVDLPVMVYCTKYLNQVMSFRSHSWFDNKDAMIEPALRLVNLTTFIPKCVLPTTTEYYNNVNNYFAKKIGRKYTSPYENLKNKSLLAPTWLNPEKYFSK
ncbi:MAG TPA: hypothetical protein PLO29_05540 [Paludibacter sp.]|nr:hypothetical protein [Paludibacter sp.]